ncbi:50S ribosomal protein L25 [Candidatus Saccharibacteria bacterium]|nr:50S ribosomal protein L25 [Candidatus Saccharibacteria bacterium]
MTNLDAPLTLQKREIVRKHLATLRKDGLVPGVIHNHGQLSVLVMAPELELGKIYHEAGKHHPLNLKVGEQDFLALIKDVHIHPVKRRIDHVVFQAIRRDEKVEAEVPIHLEGEIPAEKVGLMVLHQLDHVNVEALPKDLPDELKADAGKLAELHDKITIADLIVPAGVTVLAEADHPIATVVETKALISEEELAAEAEAAAAQAAEAAEGEEAAEAEQPEGEVGKSKPSDDHEKEAINKETPKE